MQERHSNRELYFRELSQTSRKYYLPYISKFLEISHNTRVLEVGCGEGGNLLPFVEIGCFVQGVDISYDRVKQARTFFKDSDRLEGSFVCGDFMDLPQPKDENSRFDLILLHDVIEHIAPEHKILFMKTLLSWLKVKGVLFVGFPAWHMPFGGHQQICHSKIASKIPYAHLLPEPLYAWYLRLFGESDDCCNELLSIKKAKVSIELFESLVKNTQGQIQDRVLWFINPHYEAKFNLRPRVLNKLLTKIPYVRNYFTTSCFYVISKSLTSD